MAVAIQNAKENVSSSSQKALFFVAHSAAVFVLPAFVLRCATVVLAHTQEGRGYICVYMCRDALHACDALFAQ